MTIYPIQLNLQGRQVVLVGGGKVASRKLPDLLKAGAKVAVISPFIMTDIALALEAGQIRWYAESYSQARLASIDPLLVFATTDDASLNIRIAEDAQSLGVLVNVADSIEHSDFSNMATLNRDPFTIAIASGGATPALTKHLRDQLAISIGDEYRILAQWLSELRPYIKTQIATQAERASLYERILQSDVLHLLAIGEIEDAQAHLTALLTGVVAQ